MKLNTNFLTGSSNFTKKATPFTFPIIIIEILIAFYGSRKISKLIKNYKLVEKKKSKKS